MAASTGRTAPRFRSMRVPVGARRWSLISPASTVGKKSCPKPGMKRPSGNASAAVTAMAARNASVKRAPCAERALEELVVLLAQDGEAPLEAAAAGAPAALRDATAACGRCLLQPVHRQRRHQRARQQVGGQHREYHRLGERHEQIASRSPPAGTSARTRCRCERRDQRRQRDLHARRRGSPPRRPCPARGAS